MSAGESVECRFEVCGNNCGGRCYVGGCRIAEMPRPRDDEDGDGGEISESEN